MRKKGQRAVKPTPKRKPKGKLFTGSQIRNGNPQGYMTPWYQAYSFRKVSGDFYEVLREGIPIFDAAIRRLISLNGTIQIIGDNMALVKELEDFCLNVPVNDMQKGIHAFAENAANETFEQGFSVSEFVATKKRDDIERLQVADSKRIIFRRNAQSRYEPWYRTGEPVQSNYTMPGSIIQRILTATYGTTIGFNGVEETRLNPDNKIYFSINNENSDPHGVSIFRSTEFVSQILVTLQNSMKHTAERFGDPAFHVHYAGRAGDTTLTERKNAMETEFNKIITAKRQGKSGDFFTAGGQDSKVEVTVIGHDGQLFQYEIPLRHLLEQIVAKTNLPAWMLGIYWSTTERMATLEIEAALADATIRQFAMLPEYIRLFSAFLRLRGRSWRTVTTSLDNPGDWGIVFRTPNLRDLVAQAQARFLNAQADMMGMPAATDEGGKRFKDRGGKQACKCGEPHTSYLSPHAKELHRPTPWPELDKVEAEYETTLKDKWAALANRIMTILKLTAKSYELSAKEDGIPPIESFSFTEVERAQIMKALRDWIGEFNITDENSPVRWYYGQSYSLGLIQAATMLGKERPILDILKNREIFEALVKEGFALVKNDATKVIVERILPEMEAQMLAGTNPRHVADRLDKLFSDANSDWERLTRSEMSMAAERAKLDEWTARKVKMLEFAPASDACPICLSLRGEYKISECPLPVADTHPRCRCSTRPAQSDNNG